MSRNRDAVALQVGSGHTYQRSLQSLETPGTVRRSTVVIAVASPAGGDGKTTVTVNLAAALALSGRHVLAVNCDRQDRSYRALLAGGQPSRSTPWVDASTPAGRLAVASAPIGAVPEEPRAAIRDLRGVLTRARGRFDVVLLDSPPGPAAHTVALNADALIIPAAAEPDFSGDDEEPDDTEQPGLRVDHIPDFVAGLTARRSGKGARRGLRLLGVVLTRTPIGPPSARAQQDLCLLIDAGLPIFTTVITDAAAGNDDWTPPAGNGPIALANTESLMAQQFRLLAAELTDRLA